MLFILFCSRSLIWGRKFKKKEKKRIDRNIIAGVYLWILIVLVHRSPLRSSNSILVFALVWWLVTGSWPALSWSFIIAQIASSQSHTVPSETPAPFVSSSSHLGGDKLSETSPAPRHSPHAFRERRAVCFSDVMQQIYISRQNRGELIVPRIVTFKWI